MPLISKTIELKDKTVKYIERNEGIKIERNIKVHIRKEDLKKIIKSYGQTMFGLAKYSGKAFATLHKINKDGYCSEEMWNELMGYLKEMKNK